MRGVLGEEVVGFCLEDYENECWEFFKVILKMKKEEGKKKGGIFWFLWEGMLFILIFVYVRCRIWNFIFFVWGMSLLVVRG